MKFFIQSVVRHWYRLSNEAADAPLLKVDGALGSLRWWVTALPMARGWN